MLCNNHFERKLTILMILSLTLMTLLMGVAFAAGEKFVDVKPGSCPNAVNFNSRGVLPVALLSGNDDIFEVDEIDPNSVRFGRADNMTVAPLRWHMEDVNFDGEMDLVMHFSIPELKPLFAPIIEDDDDGYVAAGISFMADGDSFAYVGDDDASGLWLKIPGFKN
ncbi:hypothetical protein [Acidaminobacter sp.]|uniref:hypothetical protein n=1 Tax=Acidaminobacter sp. TaxID=1872102 RepID=UPI0013844040|nr:hypothetical protein [Acidaminobacter sp.]MDK9710955.1 hypothetical protein [Acidaminobacter sp.]MZQ98595.1 hypothetical protein [Acidaminobacter sp.]